MRLSSRARGARASTTLQLSIEVAALRRAGIAVVSLLEGEADLPAPPEVKAAIRHALQKNFTRYSNSSGLLELKSSIARKLWRDNGIKAAADDILVTNGAKQAIYCALQTLCGPGDEVVIPAPFWVSFPEAARLACATPIFVKTVGHHLDVDLIARSITRRTKVIILNTPNNPTGAVYAKEELQAIVQLARKHDCFIIADEAYEQLVYDGRKHVSLAGLNPEAAKRAITVQTFSKSYSMTGLRIGYLVAGHEILQAATRIHGHMTGNACTVIQHGALAALSLDRKYHDKRRAIFERRRDLAYAEAANIFDCLKPRGGFFLFADARRYLNPRRKTSADLARHLLEKAHVAVLPGSACGLEGYLRISFSGPEKMISEGFKRMREALCR